MDYQKSRKNFRLFRVFVAFLIGVMLGGAFGAFSLINTRSDPALFPVSDRSEYDGVTVEDQGARCVNQIIECEAHQPSRRILEESSEF
jgi:hypothetical protein